MNGRDLAARLLFQHEMAKRLRVMQDEAEAAGFPITMVVLHAAELMSQSEAHKDEGDRDRRAVHLASLLDMVGVSNDEVH